MTFADPPPPPEPGEQNLRAKDLKNRVVVLRATGTGIDESKPDSRGRPWEWTTCDCWLIDRSGIEHYEPNLRISWWRVRDQLKEADGKFVAGRVTEQDDNSITLVAVTGAARQVVTDVMPEIVATAKATSGEEPPWTDEDPL